MASLSATPTPITPPRVPLIDERTGLIDRAWYLFFLSMFNSTLSIEDLQKAPDTNAALATYDALLRAVQQAAETQRPDQTQEIQQAVDTLRQEVQTWPRQELGTFAALQQANLPWTTFDTTPEVVPDTVPGTVYWSTDNATLDVVLEGGVTGEICQQLDFHPKNTSGVQINKGQTVMATGVVGASTKITCAKAVANGSVLPQFMLGIAAQNIPANSFGYVVWFGAVRGFNTTGANKTVPETWVDGDVLYFDPAYPGELTKFEPSAPNLDLPIAIITNAANNGAIFVRMKTGENLDELHDVHAPAPSNNDVLVYDAAQLRWESTGPTAARDALGLGTGDPTNGQLLIGNGTDFTTANLTAGSNIVITNGAGSVSIAATGSGGGPVGSVTSVDASGGTTGMTFSGGPITSSGTLTMAGTLVTANGGTGQTTYTDGQLLIGNTSTGSLTKTTLSAGTGVTITNGAGSITIASTASGGSPTLVVVTGTTQAATANNHYVLTNVATTTVTLPATPTAGDIVWVTVGNGLTTNVVARNGSNIQSLAEDLTLNAAYAAVQMRYINSTIGWTFV